MTDQLSRLAPLTPETLDPAQRRLYQTLTAGPRASGPFTLVAPDGSLTGPFNALLLAPGLGDAVQALGAAIRFGGALDDRSREIAILVVAAVRDSAFERYAHEAVGREVGLTDVELRAIRDLDADAFSGLEALVLRTAVALARDGQLDDAAYAEAVAALGEAGVLELVTLVGYYALLALQMCVFGDVVPDAPPAGR